MYELIVDDQIIGVFTSELTAQQHALMMKIKTYQIVPLGTFLETDIK